MRQLSRLFGAIAVVFALAACGIVTRDGTSGQTVPEPSTPVQKATASPANPDSATLADFNARLDKYIKFQRGVAKGSLKLKETTNPSEITAAQEILAAKIRALRKSARQGDIFAPHVAAMFRRLMDPELRGEDGPETKATIGGHDAPPAVPMKVNAKYPDAAPLPTIPPNLLAALPQLPMDVEYRIVGKHLILRDVDANIIVDYIPNAIR